MKVLSDCEWCPIQQDGIGEFKRAPCGATELGYRSIVEWTGMSATEHLLVVHRLKFMKTNGILFRI